VSPLAIRPMTTEAEACAALMAATEPWLTLRRDRAACLRFLQEPGRDCHVAYLDGRLAGVLVLNFQGGFKGYLQAICVDPDLRGQGLGTALLDFAEERIFREHPNVFLCVSAFNHGARRLYERSGYRVVGELTDYVIQGQSEILMRKTRGPLAP